MYLAFTMPAFSQVIIDDGTDTGGGAVTFEEQDTTGKIDFDIDLSGKFTQDYFHNGKRLENAQGVPVTAYNISPDQSLIIGTTDPNVDRITINKKIDFKDDSKAIASFIHKNGEHQSLPPDQITAHDKDGNNKCLSVEPIGGKHNPIAAHIVIDRSGSMDGHMPSVKSALGQFTNAVPPSSLCSVTSFASSATDHTNGFEMCRGVAGKISGIKASGSTDLYRTLIDGYSKIDQSPAIQNFILAITDGFDTSWTSLDDVKAAKNAQTFVLWAGAGNSSQLASIADATLNARGNIPAALNVFFEKLGQAVAKQQVIVVPHTCAESSTGDRSEAAPAPELKKEEPAPAKTIIVEKTEPEPTNKTGSKMTINFTDFDPNIHLVISNAGRSITAQYHTDDNGTLFVEFFIFELDQGKGDIITIARNDVEVKDSNGNNKCFDLSKRGDKQHLAIFPSC